MRNSIYILLIFLTSWCAKGTAAAPPGKNLIFNGDFKAVTTKDNLWDGVDSTGCLMGNIGGAPVPLLTLSGWVGGTPVPVSVNLVDLNGDGLPDLVVASTSGYVFAYFNSGTKTEPKFTNGEVLPMYLARGYLPSATQIDTHKTGLWRKAPRINLYDWSHSGRLDMLVGNYRGELLFIPNKGSRNAPDFKQPPLEEAQTLSISKPWGNLFAPVAYDFDGDGKVDVAFGEGSYSANSIHLFLNRGTNTVPKFDEGAHSVIAYGDGNEQLVPALADYNGDGSMDLLVGDREGRVAIYLNPGKSWKPGMEFKFSKYITFGSVETLGGAVAPYAGDYNGDGLFDLVFGRVNGHIAVAINKGTKEEPKFDAPVDIKGVDVWANNMNYPNPGPGGAGWSMDAGTAKGNPYGYFSVVTNKEDPEAAIPGDRNALKAGFFPSPNVVFKSLLPAFPGTAGNGNFFAHWYGNTFVTEGAGNPGFLCPSNEFIARCILTPNALQPGKSYKLSFNVKGSGFSKGEWKFAFHGRTKSEEQQTHGDRGSVTKTYADLKVEQGAEEGSFSASPKWTEFHKTVSVRFREPDLKNPDRLEAVMGVLELRATLKQNDGVLYVDDVQLVETP